MARGKYRSSAEIEAQIQALLEKKKKALERETISKITNEVVQRIKEICKNFERNVFKKKQANEKKETKETTEAA